METSNGVKRQEIVVQDGDDLEQATSRAMYANCLIGEIRTAKGKEHMELKVLRQPKRGAFAGL